MWRRRFAAGGPDVLTHDAPGRGRKRQITAAREQQVVDATLHTKPPRATHLPVVCQALGIDAHEHHHVVGGFDKSATKAKMRSLKAKLQAELDAHDHGKVKALRRQLHRLNHQVRAHVR